MTSVFKPSLAQNLLGKWQLHRKQIGTPSAQACGEAIIIKTPYSGIYAYAESGTTTLENGKTLSFNQSYRFVWEADETLRIDKPIHTSPENWQELHRFQFIKTPDGHLANHTHICKPDVYKAQMLLMNPHRFALSYLITGPYKDYALETIYQKI